MSGNLSCHPIRATWYSIKSSWRLSRRFMSGVRALLPLPALLMISRLGRFARLKLALYLEETFEVEISDEAVADFDTVDDIVRYMSRWSLASLDLSEYTVRTLRGKS